MKEREQLVYGAARPLRALDSFNWPVGEAIPTEPCWRPVPPSDTTPERLMVTPLRSTPGTFGVEAYTRVLGALSPTLISFSKFGLNTWLRATMAFCGTAP